MIGQTISHYRIIEKIGEGGMGVVYLAEDTHLARRVAIKFLSSPDRHYRARFLREARAVSALSHANIGAVYDYGETDDGQPYIVMELVKGQTLGQLLEGESLTLVRSLQIVSSIADALGEAHHQGIVHRDVKPSNVVITERGQVKVLDFGLVKQIFESASSKDTDASAQTLFSTHTRSDVIVGTPLYFSPEQATGKPVDGRSDLFALGALLYECISGRMAFSGSSLIEIGAQVIHVEPPPPSRFNPHISPELDRITMKALAKKPEARYQSADEMVQDLRSVLATVTSDNHSTPRLSPRSTSSLHPPPTSALITLSETLRRPRLSLGTVIIGLLAIGVASWAIARLWKPALYVPSPVARDWYNKGTDAMRNGAFLQATLALKQAILADDKYALAHARLAEALTELDYADDAKNEMLRATELVPDRSQLPPIDALYLEGVLAVVTGDFPNSVKAYSEIAKLSPEDPQVYFDLGRAYEKNDDTKKAIETYIEATSRSPQLAAAYLRVGVLYGRQLDLASASANFQQAETLYEALGSIEGQAEVFYERGFLLNKLGKVSEAREQLQRALALAQTAHNQYQEVKTLLKLGDVANDAGEPAQAQQNMLQAINLARANGIDNLTKRGLVDLGNVFLVSGNYAEAKKYYEQSLELAQKQKDSRNAARALLSLGSLAERQSSPDDAVRYIEQALPFYRQGGYRKELSQAFALLARAKVQKGEYEAALKAYEEQLRLAQELGDQSQAGTVIRDVGIVFTTLARYPEALTKIDESYSIAKSLGNHKDIGLSLTLRANILWRLGRYEEAQTSLTQASSIAEQANASKSLSSWYSLAVARMALSRRQFPEAKVRSQQALTLAGTNLKGTAVEANYTLGLAQALSGAASEGRNQCERAVEIATQSKDPALLSEALLSLAETQLLSGDAAGALTTAINAQEILGRVGKQDSEWVALAIAARASRSAGDATKAQEFARRAEDLLNGLSTKWGAENYNGYLSRPDIQFVRKQLSESLR
ncbi:MAG: tetratricopeptide repeat protein [Pyrinomonadaceae bacterium]|nr:tetratricopeptide repeat protein [Pyrinomonadaceae bacterium]